MNAENEAILRCCSKISGLVVCDVTDELISLLQVQWQPAIKAALPKRATFSHAGLKSGLIRMGNTA